jgi:hypothetical protein
MTDPASLLELLSRLQAGLLQAEAMIDAQGRRIQELEQRDKEASDADH